MIVWKFNKTHFKVAWVPSPQPKYPFQLTNETKMESITCPKCRLTDWADSDNCKRCGSNFNDLDHSALEETLPQKKVKTDYAVPYNSAKKPSIRLAVTSLVFGIAGFPFISMIWGALLATLLAIALGTVGATVGGVIAILILPIGLILGIVALVKSKRHPEEYGGKGLAIAGIACSSIGVLMMPVILGTLIPNLIVGSKSSNPKFVASSIRDPFSARRSLNEGRVVANVRMIASAQLVFRASERGLRDPSKGCSSLEELGRRRLINSVLAKGQESGYRYVVSSSTGECEIMAAPISESEGTRSFYLSMEDNWILRAAAKNGEFANKTDPPLEPRLNKKKPQVSSRKN